MKKLIFILILFCYSYSEGQLNVPLINKGSVTLESNAQRITDMYCTLVNASNSETYAIKKAVRALEDYGLYDKIFKLTIYKYFSNGRCPNVIIPILYNGAFCDSLRVGSVTVNSNGIVMGVGDTLATYWINDITSDAPYNGFFWYVGSSVSSQILSSTSPFKIYPRDVTSAYVNIWANSPGVAVPAPPTGFNYAQRTNSTTVDIYQGTIKFSATSATNSSIPINQWCEIIGNSTADYTLKMSGFVSILTDAQEASLKLILDTLATDLGL